MRLLLTIGKKSGRRSSQQLAGASHQERKAAQSPELPYEIILIILQNLVLELEEDVAKRRVLLTGAHISKAWLAPAQEQLYRTIHLQSFRQTVNLQRTLEENRDLASRVIGLFPPLLTNRFSAVPKDSPAYDPNYWLQTLDGLQRYHRLNASQQDYSSTLQIVAILTRLCPNLREFGIPCSTRSDSSSFGRFFSLDMTQINSLEYLICQTDMLQISPSDHPVISLPRLRRLVLIDTWPVKLPPTARWIQLPMLDDLTFNAFFPSSFIRCDSLFAVVQPTLTNLRLAKCDLQFPLILGLQSVPLLLANITHLSCELRYSFLSFPLSSFEALEYWSIYVTNEDAQVSYRGTLPKLKVLEIRASPVFGFRYWEKYMAVRLAPLLDFGARSSFITPSIQELRLSLGVLVDGVPQQERTLDLAWRCQNLFKEAEGGAIMFKVSIEPKFKNELHQVIDRTRWRARSNVRHRIKDALSSAISAP